MGAAMRGRVLHAPIERPERLLDVGCGTGAVTDILATKFPAAEAFGLDLSTVPSRQRPANAHFLQGNFLTKHPTAWIPISSTAGGASRIGQDADIFDLIFCRLLILGMKDWPGYFATAYTLLRPGGWVEVQDLDMIVRDNATGLDTCADFPWFIALANASRIRGLDITSGSNALEHVKKAGFVDTSVHEYHFPLGGKSQTDPVMRAFGDFFLGDGIQVFAMLLQSAVKDGQKPEQVEKWVDDMTQIVSNMLNIYLKFTVTVGRKPQKT